MSAILQTCHTAIMLKWQRPKILFIYVQTQPTAMCASHVIAKYVPETNISTTLDICHIFDSHIQRMYTLIYAIYGVNDINHATQTAVQLFDLYH